MNAKDKSTSNAMKKIPRKTYLAFIVLLIFTMVGVGISYSADRGFGKIDVQQVTFMTPQNVPMHAKVYRPTWVTEKNPAPGILALHGYQSDKEATTTFGTIELARRGFVVLSIDQFGQGYSTQFPVSPKIMSGAQYGLDYLKSLPMVTPDNLGVFGHSTGSIYAVNLALENPEIQATVALSGNGGNPDIAKIKNYLLIQGNAEEIGGYRENTFPVSSLSKHPKRLAAFGLDKDDTLIWNHLYGSFADGSARMVKLISGTHLGVMTSGDSNTSVVSWFNDALRGGEKDSHWIPASSHVYQWKEIGGAIALFSLLGTIIPLLSVLMETPVFSSIRKSSLSLPPASRKTLVISAVVSVLATIILYPLFTQYGGGKDPISAHIGILPLQMGNGIILWLLATTLVGVISFVIWKRSYGKDISFGKLGIWGGRGTCKQIGLSLVLSALILGWVLFVVNVVAFMRGPEIRVLWPMLKTYTPERALVFFPYFVIILLFFIVINGLNLHVQSYIARKENESDFFLWFRRSSYGVFTAVGGLVLLWLFHFVPDFLGIGPGFDVIGLPTYGGRWMMMLSVIIPQFITLVLLNTWIQLRTKSIWVASTIGAGLFALVLVGGQVGTF